MSVCLPATAEIFDSEVKSEYKLKKQNFAKSANVQKLLITELTR